MRNSKIVEPSEGREAPQSPDAERAILGAILINNNVMFRIGNITAESFFKERHKTIFSVMSLMAEERVEIEPLTLKEELAKRGLFEECGGVVYISSLLDTVPDVANVERYAQIVERMAKKRAGIIAGYALVEKNYDPETEPEQVAAETMAALGRQATREEMQAKPFAPVLCDALDAQKQRGDGQQDDIALKTGHYPTLDALRAIKRSFIVIGAPSESGKTTHAINLFDGLAMNNHPTAFFTLESTEDEVALRYASMKSGVNHALVQDWKLMKDGDLFRIQNVRKQVAQAPMFISRRIRTIEQMYLECRRLREMEGIDAVIADYIQLLRMKNSRHGSNREEMLAEVSQTLLEMSVELGIGVIAMSQVREDWQKRESGRILKEDLKYARAIGETARVVLMFYRPRTIEKANRELKWCEVRYSVEKNSENRTEDVPMHMNEDTQRFREGDCYANDCHTVRQERKPPTLFGYGDER